jgi:hypothetical protein|uniref:Uncharacterized protein n=1 Tax=viral metagenome TaxID=1070528 RepID=A0A6C0CKX2_9ZZZZ
MSSTIYIIDGGVFSPPTKATGQLAFNISSFISSKHPKKKIQYHFLPSNKYYNKPWVRCVSEEDRIIMLDNLVKYITSNYKIPSKISFIVDDSDIKWGKINKAPSTTINTLKNNFSKKQFSSIYLANSIDNIIQRIKGNWDNSLELFFMVKFIVYDIFSSQIIGDNTKNYLLKSFDLPQLLKQGNGNFPEKINKFFKQNNISKQDIIDFIDYNKNPEKFEEIKNIIMENIIILPKHLVPDSYKSMAGNRVREELDVFYSSLENLKKFITPKTEKYILDNKLYHHCKSTYQSKLISKTKKSKSKKSKSKSKSKKSKSKKSN